MCHTKKILKKGGDKVQKKKIQCLIRLLAVCFFLVSYFPFTILSAQEITQDNRDEVRLEETSETSVDEDIQLDNEDTEQSGSHETNQEETVDSLVIEPVAEDSEADGNESASNDSEPAKRVARSDDLVTGVWGTVPWEYDAENQTITLYGGEGGTVASTPWRTYRVVERIIVEESVTLPPNSTQLFASLTNLVAIVHCHNLDFTNVTTTAYMFLLTPNLSQVAASNWNVSNVTVMEYMFSRSGVTTLDLSAWNVTNVTRMNDMFSETTALETLDVTGWDTSSVTAFDRMFQNSGITVLDLSTWSNDNFFSKPNMFQNARSLKRLVLGEGFHLIAAMNLPMIQEDGYTGRWIRRGSDQVMDYDNVFEDSVAFMQGYGEKDPGSYEWEPVLSLWGTVPWEFKEDTQTIILYGGDAGEAATAPWKTYGSVNKIIVNDRVLLPAVSSSLFAQLRDLEIINNVGNLDVSQVRLMDWMFESTRLLRELDVSNWDMSNVTSIERMFAYSAVASLDVSNWVVSEVTNMDSTFLGVQMSTLAIDKWDVSKVTTMEGMFRHTGLKHLDLSGWDVENVEQFAWMFQYSEIENLNVSGWHLDQAVSMRAMFQGTKFQQLDVSDWDISNVDDLGWMFRGSAIRSLDLSNWDTTNVTLMENMFEGASYLKKLVLGEASIFSPSVLLPEIVNNEFYTGNWLLQNHSDTDVSILYTSSREFMADYDGSQPGIYVWEAMEPKVLTAKLYPVSDQSTMIVGYMTEEVDTRVVTYQNTNGETITIENDSPRIIWGDYQDDSEWTRAFHVYLAEDERLETGSEVSITLSKPSVHNTGDVYTEETVIKGITYEAGNITIDRFSVNDLADTEALHQLILTHSQPFAKDLLTNEDLSDSFRVITTDLTIDIELDGTRSAILEVGNKAYQMEISIDVTSQLEHMRVTIPTKMLFTSLYNEEESNREFESQEYQIRNHSTIPVDAYVNRLVVERDAGIHLLTSSESPLDFVRPQEEDIELDGLLQPLLQLGVKNVNESIPLYERMDETKLLQLAPRTSEPIKLQGHFYGPYPMWIEDQEMTQGGYYEESFLPSYRMVLRFVPR